MEVKRMFTDDELLENIRSRKKLNEAIQFIYRNYFESLSWFIINNHGTSYDAEVIFQEVVTNFIEATRNNQYKGEPSVKIFLFALNKYNWLDELKKRNRSLSKKIKYPKINDISEMDATSFVTGRDERNKVFDLFDSLNPTCKKILLLFYFENKSMEEILVELEYENEQVVRNKKDKCLKQIGIFISAVPLLNANLKKFLYG